MAKEIPVYIFTGFLDGGKTMFIQDTLEDSRFNSGEKTLLLVCEEGEEEYDPSKFSGKNVTIKVIDSIENMTEARLDEYAKSIKAERVMVEYNGMWNIQNFYDSMPDGWIPYQNMLFCDSNSILGYNSNMRQLVVDKLKDADVVVFNRIPKDTDTMPFHKLVRAVSRRSDVLYEYSDGTLIPDEIEDPLPFDVNAPVIKIEDRDYALFYRDLTEDIQKYKGKTVSMKVVAATDKKFPDKTCALGRHIMTCCAADITYCPLVSKIDGFTVDNGAWYEAEAEIDIRFSRLYGKKGPVLTVKKLVPAAAPEEPVATFY